MKRRIFKLFVFLLLGAIVNVVVAWGCALLDDGPTFADPGRYVQATESDLAAVRRMHEEFDANGEVVVLRSIGWTHRRIPIVDEEFWKAIRQTYESGGRTTFVRPCITRSFCGLPLRSLAGEVPFRRSFTLIRLRPIFPGFAINTIFYAAILWVLCAVPGSVRRWRRRRRGLCPACAYPVGQSPTCTECGAAVDQNRARQEAAA
jgi:hypothetical protein